MCADEVNHKDEGEVCLVHDVDLQKGVGSVKPSGPTGPRFLLNQRVLGLHRT